MSAINLTQFEGNKTDMTYKQKYYYDDQYFNSQEAIDQGKQRPILFYTGGESSIT